MDLKESAVIFDIDGTLAHMVGRIERHGKRAAPYLDNDAYDDEVDEEVLFINHLIGQHTTYKILIVSGRKDSSYNVLIQWLKDKNVMYDDVFMRQANDNRSDDIVKEEIYKTYIEPLYEVEIIFDDRDRVVKKWRELGLKCFQVQEGSF